MSAAASPVDSGAAALLTDEELTEAFTKINEHNKAAARPSHAEMCRTLMAASKFGVLSTISAQGASEGFPNAGVIGFAVDDQGHPIFALSSLSAHTRDVMADGRVAFTIAATEAGMSADAARVTVTGMAIEAEGDDAGSCRETYLNTHEGAFWVDFGDFSWWRLEDIRTIRYVGGFGRAHSVSPADFSSASPDPVSPFAGPVAGHMNDDHRDAIVACARAATDVVHITDATIVGLDRLGLDVKAVVGEERFSVRLPFDEPAESRKDLKDRIVDMSKKAAAA